MNKRTATLFIVLVTTAIACGESDALQTSEDNIAVAADADCLFCTDPTDVGDVKRGGGAGVGTSSTAAVAAAKAAAETAACNASEATATAPPCVEPMCVPVQIAIDCTYANFACPVVSDFGTSPREWIAACRASKESAAWKAANCNRRTGPAGKPNFALCTVDATAKIETNCEPSGFCEEAYLDVRETDR